MPFRSDVNDYIDDKRDHRQLPTRARLIAVAASALLLGGLVAVAIGQGGTNTSADNATLAASSQDPVAVDGTPAYLFESAEDCKQPTPRPADPTAAAAWDLEWGTEADAQRAIEEARRTGWIRTMGQSLTSDLWVCAWRPFIDEDGVRPEGAFDDEGRQIFYDAPNGAIKGYSYTTLAYVSVEELADPTFDVEAAMMEKFGCVMTLTASGCGDEIPSADE